MGIPHIDSAASAKETGSNPCGSADDNFECLTPTVMKYDTITLNLDQPIAELTLNCPERRNALSSEMLDELSHAINRVAKSECLGLLFQSSGTVFSAGHDFNDLLGVDEQRLHALLSKSTQVALSLRRLEIPVLTQVQGPAIGAGCQLAISGDFVVGSDLASFQTPGGARGWFCFTPMVALLQVLPHRRAFEMLFTGEAMKADEALRFGILNRVVGPEELAEASRDLLQKAICGSRANKGFGKQFFYEMTAADETRFYERALDLMAKTGVGSDAQARIRKFFERRDSAANG